MPTLTDRQQPLETIANRLRRDSLISTDAAGSGHPTSCLSCAELMAVLFFERIRLDLDNPEDLANDHFILSKGHAAPILWATLHQAGAISDEELKTLRSFDSDLEGHPTPRNHYVDIASGSLGQGLSAGLGFAIADQLENRDNRAYVLAGDGELAEGSFWEAAALASHKNLENLTLLIDVNAYGQTGLTMLQHDLETYRDRLVAFGWKVATVEEGNSIQAIREAFDSVSDAKGQPVAIIAKTVKGKGVADIEGDKGSHGKPSPDLEAALEALPDDLELDEPPRVRKPEVSIKPRSPYDDKPIELSLPEDSTIEEPLSPRKAYGMALEQLVKQVTEAIVLDGDVSNSTYTQFVRENFPSQFVECYIAEQNMVGMALGLHQAGRRPFVATFAAFLSRAFDQIRMAAISQAKISFAGTHAGIATGEDGPSQMGLEDIALFRSIPHSIVLQPCDTVSVFRCLELSHSCNSINYLRLFRPDARPIYPKDTKFRIGGSHTLLESDQDVATIVASGATVSYALEAAEQLMQNESLPVRVIDCYSIKPVDGDAIRQAVRKSQRLVVVEDHYPEGGLSDAVHTSIAGERYASETLCVKDVPRSGSAARLAEAFEIDSEAISRAVKRLIAV